MATTEDEPATTLGAALEREHRDIDGGIEAFIAHSADGARDPAPLVRAMAGLRRHIYLEEEFLFPPLKAAGMMMPIFVMLREHGGLWNAMDALEARLNDATTDESLVSACRELFALLDAHNSKEEPIIYTQADRILSAKASDELREFLADGHTPDGWTCAQAA
jgi:regulator of cell morphogenesis and NO signaling